MPIDIISYGWSQYAIDFAFCWEASRCLCQDIIMSVVHWVQPSCVTAYVTMSHGDGVICCKCMHTCHMAVVLYVIIDVSRINSCYGFLWVIHTGRHFTHVIYYMNDLIVGQHNQFSLLSIAQLTEMHLSVIGVLQSFNLLLGSKALTINSTESACKQMCCKTW